MTTKNTMTKSGAHTLKIDLALMTLTIEGPTEGMDAIPDAEIEAAAHAAGVAVDWARGPLDETSYPLVALDDGEPDRLQTSLDAAAAAMDAERNEASNLLSIARAAYLACALTRRGATSAIRCYEAARTAAREATRQTALADTAAGQILEEISGRSLNEIRWAAFDGGVGG